MVNPVLLGKPFIICQVYDSLFHYKTKYHRGRTTENKLWVLVIADPLFVPVRIFLKLIEDRSAVSLIPKILNVCRSGTVIISDKWRAYVTFHDQIICRV